MPYLVSVVYSLCLRGVLERFQRVFFFSLSSPIKSLQGRRPLERKPAEPPNENSRKFAPNAQIAPRLHLENVR